MLSKLSTVDGRSDGYELIKNKVSFRYDCIEIHDGTIINEQETVNLICSNKNNSLAINVSKYELYNLISVKLKRDGRCLLVVPKAFILECAKSDYTDHSILDDDYKDAITLQHLDTVHFILFETSENEVPTEGLVSVYPELEKYVRVYVSEPTFLEEIFGPYCPLDDFFYE